ncbi:MAG: protein kinase [Chloroflexi bacterium]|nr:protein kinase [Chloroflexota bacterium]
MEDLTGKQLGPYQVVSPLGEGGMASVYKAFQPSVDRYVALKVLPQHYAKDPEFVTRFTQEARVIANLQHPHILPVHDFGETDGYTFMAMRFIRGGTLSEWMLKNQPLSMPQIRRIISQIGDALDYAHSQGVIHRDIKPGNVLIDERGNCLLTDFGLAKLMETSIKLTRTGGILGTPAYMSPEQGMGQGVDHRSDIYALGVILYEMVTGRPPYQAETPMAIMIKHISAPLPPPHKYKPDISEDIERVILKTLAKEKTDRYESAGDMVQALQQATEPKTIVTGDAPPTVAAIRMPPVVEDEVAEETAVPPPAPQPPPPEPEEPVTEMREEAVTAPPTTSRKRPAWLYAVIGIVVLGILGFGLVALLNQDDDPSDDDPFTGNDLPDDDLPDDDLPDDDLPDVEPFTGDTPPIIDRLVDDAHNNQDAGDYDTALDLINEAIEHEPGIAELYCVRGNIYRDLRDFEEAEANLTACREISQEIGDEELAAEAGASVAMMKMETTLDEGPNFEEARNILTKAIEMPAAPPWLYCERAELNLSFVDNEAALADFRECLNQFDDDYWQFRSESVTNMIEGEFALNAEDFDRAIMHFERWAELNPDDPWPFCSLGFAFTGAGDFGQAHDKFNHCNDLAEEYEDTELQKQAESGDIYVSAKEAYENGRLQEAIEHYSHAIDLTPDNAWLFCERGETHWELDNPRDAREDFETCLEMSDGDPTLREWAQDALEELR